MTKSIAIIGAGIAGITTAYYLAREGYSVTVYEQERYPAMQEKVDEGIAVSINGDIYRDNWSEPIPANAEIFLLPRIAGG